MKEMIFCSHRDPSADALAKVRQPELPVKPLCGSETSYDQVLHAMRSQETLFYSERVRSGY